MIQMSSSCDRKEDESDVLKTGKTDYLRQSADSTHWPSKMESVSRADVQSESPLDHDKEKTKCSTTAVKRKSNKCRLCATRPPAAYDKKLCESCIAKLLKQEQSSLLDNIRTMIREEVQATISTTEPPQVPSPKRPRWSMDPSSEEEVLGYSDLNSAEGETSSVLLSGDRKRYLFSSKDTDTLVQAVRNTMKVEESTEPKTVQDEMFRGLRARRDRVFPMNNHISAIILEEWEDVRKKLIVPKDFKFRLPFNPEDTKTWETVPKIDIPVARVSKETAVPFEDSSGLKDLLKKSWEASAAIMKANVAATSVARSMCIWVEEFETQIKNRTPREEILKSLPLLKMATDFMADASVESVRFAASGNALFNAARRAAGPDWPSDISGKCQKGLSGQLNVRSLTAVHLKGEKNKVADFLSRKKIQPTEWALNQGVFLHLTNTWGFPEIDLFASRENSKTKRFFSLNPGDNPTAVDALAQDWDMELACAFPPLPLIPRVLRKIQESQTTEPDIPQILDFLQAGFDNGLKPNTLKVQISALISFFDYPLTEHPWVDGNQGKHRVTKRGPALSYPMFTLVTSKDIAESRTRASTELGVRFIKSERENPQKDNAKCEHSLTTRAGGVETGAGGVETPVQTRAGGVETPVQTGAGGVETPVQTRAGGVETPVQTRAGGVETPVQTRAGGVETPVQTRAGGVETPVQTRAGGVETSVQTRAGGVETPVQTHAGGVETSVQTRAGGVETPVQTRAGGVETAVQTRAGGVETPVQTRAGGVETPVQTGAGGVETPVQTGAGGVETPVQTGAGGVETPVQTGAGGVETPVQTRAGGVETPVQTGAGGVETPVQTPAGGVETPVQTRAGGVETPVQTPAGGVETPVQTPAGGVETPVQTPAGGVETPVQTPAGGVETPVQTPAGGVETPVQTPAGGVETPVQTRAGGVETPVQTPAGAAKVSRNDPSSSREQLLSNVVLIQNVPDSCPSEMLSILIENISDKNDDSDFYLERIPEIHSAVITFTCDIGNIQKMCPCIILCGSSLFGIFLPLYLWVATESSINMNVQELVSRVDQLAARALGLLYDEPNSVDQAEKILLALCQGQEAAELYCQKFRKWSVLTKWNEDALAAIFRKGLSESVKDVMDVFDEPKSSSLPPHRDCDCAIDLIPGCKFPKGRLFNLSVPEHTAMRSYIKESLEKGHIRPSSSPLGAGIKGSSWFTKIDLRGAYDLIRIKQGDEWKTAFNTPEGHFEYLVMPFGLSNAPSVFQSFMHDIFRSYLDKFMVVYLDDILIFSNDRESHVKQVRMVFQILQMNPVKVQAIHDWIQPTSVKSLQKFLGFANFYRRFIANFSRVVKPLTGLTKKGADVTNWSSAAVSAFQELKSRFTSAPVLRQPDVSLPFQVEVDTSEIGAGAVLSQRNSDGSLMKPCAFFSLKFSPAERNYDVGNRELLAMKWAFEEWRHWLEGAKHRIVVLTDHKNLIYLESAKRLNPRQARWSLFFSRFDFVVSYIPGTKNTNGQTERTNQTLETYLRCFVSADQDDWVEPSDLPGVDSVVDRLQQIWAYVVDNLVLSQEEAQRFANRRRCVGSRLRVGDLVWVSSRHVSMKISSPKFKPRFIGPYRISEIINPVSFRLVLPASFAIHNVFHRSLLRKYVEPVVPSVDPPAPVLVDGELEYVVEKILDSHFSRRKLQYHVKWKGYGQEDNSWVSASDVHAVDLVHRAHPDRPGGSDIFSFIQKFCRNHRVNQQKLTVKPLEETRSIRAEGLPPKTEEDHLIMYFESSKVGGGPVDKATMIPKEEAAVVTFCDARVVKVVVGKEHIFGKKAISVYRYYPSLDIALYGRQRPHVIRPEPVHIQISPYLLAFILKQAGLKQNIEKNMSEKMCEIKWPDPACSNPEISLCFPDSLSSHLRTMAKVVHTWTEEVSAKFSLFISKYKVIDCKMNPSVWEDLKDQISTAAYDGVLIKPNPELEKIFLAGTMKDVNKIEQTFRKLVEETSRKVERRSKVMTMTEPMSAALYHIIHSSGLESKILADVPELGMEYDPSTHNVRLTGLREEVLQAKCEIMSARQQLKSKYIQLDPYVHQFLMFADNDEVSCLLFARHKINALIEMEENLVQLTGHSKKDMMDAEQQINRELICQRIPVAAKKILESPEWRSLQSHLQESFNSEMCTVMIQAFPSGAENDVVLAGMSTNVHKSYKAIHEFVEHNTPMQLNFQAKSMAVMKFIMEEKKYVLDSLKQSTVSVAIRHRNINLSGTKSCVEEAASVVQNLLSSVHHNTLHIDKPGAKKFFLSHEELYVTTAKNKHKCVIYLQKDEEEDDLPNESAPNVALYQMQLPQGATLSVYKGDLCRHIVDVIVNAANEDLKHVGGLAMALLTAAGPKLQEASDRIVRQRGRLFPGDAVITEAGNLPCKQVIHTVGPRWNSTSPQRGQDGLQEAIRKSLLLAAKHGHKSIAIPAVSSGIFGFPTDVSAQSIVDAIKEFVEGEGSSSSITNINLVDTKDETISAFTECLKRQFGDGSSPRYSVKRAEDTGPQTRELGATAGQMMGNQNIIKVEEGLLQDVTTDVIVNSVGKDLHLDSGGASRALSEKAGAQLQVCLRTEAAGSKADDGAIFVTPGCSLSCNSVIHVVLPKWDGGKGSAEKIFRKTIRSCLDTVEKRRLRSITFPAIGTGSSGIS
ncbi:unnamed protein product [Ranitomeya imitator]|uniref:ribonuclease H n=1 Tax=Ranitomeya imitator TaxID=111125 RepID=A0ABN9LWP5_9NEOB|nr:unnamed protein product [Ranitomeya imitator]